MSVKMRQRVEREIASAFIDEALSKGYSLNLNNGGDEHELKSPTKDKGLLLDAMFATDEEHILVYKGDERFGWVFLVYGNGGWDVISDYTTNLEDCMEKARELSDYYSS